MYEIWTNSNIGDCFAYLISMTSNTIQNYGVQVLQWFLVGKKWTKCKTHFQVTNEEKNYFKNLQYKESISGTLHSYQNMAYNFFDMNAEQRFGTRIKLIQKGNSKKFDVKYEEIETQGPKECSEDISNCVTGSNISPNPHFLLVVPFWI